MFAHFIIFSTEICSYLINHRRVISIITSLVKGKRKQIKRDIKVESKPVYFVIVKIKNLKLNRLICFLSGLTYV